MSIYAGNGSLVITLVIVAMAVHQATNVLLRSSLLASLRDNFENGVGYRYVPDRVYGFLQRLFECSWCMSIQLSWILLLPFTLEPLGEYLYVMRLVLNVGEFLVTAAAVSFAANLMHSFFGHEGPGSS